MYLPTYNNVFINFIFVAGATTKYLIIFQEIYESILNGKLIKFIFKIKL